MIEDLQSQRVVWNQVMIMTDMVKAVRKTVHGTSDQVRIVGMGGRRRPKDYPLHQT